MIVETIIDAAQDMLHDDGKVWGRDELLEWLNDGYRQLLAQSCACNRPYIIDVPGRHAWAGTQEWEDRHGPGTFRKFTESVNSGAIQASSKWEAESIDGIASTQSLEGVTQLWERTLSGHAEARFSFITSKAHEKPVRIYWDDRRLMGASVREMDMLDTDWFQQGGRPIFAFPNGRDGTYEVYQMVTDYAQGYDCKNGESGGLPRLFSGSRTYVVDSPTDRWAYAYTDSGSAGAMPGLGFRITGQATDESQTFYVFDWEREHLEGGTDFEDSTDVGSSLFDNLALLGVGVAREIRSTDRQYVPAPYDSGAPEICGIPRDYKSSEDSLTIWEAIVPTRPLTEADSLAMIPKQFGKYLKFYVLSRAFSRKGEGFRPDLAQHFTSLFQVGVGVLKKIANLGYVDRVYARESFRGSPTGRPPAVQLPASFERQF